MPEINRQLLSLELKQGLSKPFRLPINLTLAAIGTLACIFLGIFFNTFHRGLPYIAANVFIWTLATYNASQLGSDSTNVLAYLKTKSSIKQLFLVKNLVLLVLSFPIDIILIIIACNILGDWSNFPEAIVLGLSAVIICLGLGNIVSTLWVYTPKSLIKIRHDRLQIYEYSVFITLAYISATFSLLIAYVPALIIIHYLNYRVLPGSLLSIGIMFAWAIIIWLSTLKISINISEKNKNQFIGRLSGNPIIIRNKKLKKILRV